MGLSLSLLGDAKAQAPPKVVLVPPMFERDLRARSRFAKSSYQYLFSKPNMKWLFSDLLDMRGPQAVAYFSPPADENLNVKAKIGLASSAIIHRS